PGARTTRTTSLRPAYRTFASAAARRTPASGGSLAKFAGASGDTGFGLSGVAGAVAGDRPGRPVMALREATVFAFRTGALISLLRVISGAESVQVPPVAD